MAAGQQPQGSEAQIAVHWREEGYYYPPAKFIGQANAADPAIRERFSEAHFPECFKEYADLLSWEKYWHTTLDTSNPPFWKWFVGGRLNACYNCVDRHLASDRNKAALIWVPEPEAQDTQAITYQELYRRVNEFAALLRDFGQLKTGDRVTFHMPMVPELPVSMLACARLGVIHSEVFGGFSGGACGDRIADSGSRVLVTMDGYYRNGDLVDHKAKADEAVATAPGPVRFEEPDGRGPGLLRRRRVDRLPGPRGRAGVDAGRGAAVPDVHQRYDGPAQGLRAQHRRLPRLCGGHVEVLPGHQPAGHLLVFRRHRLDHRAFLHRLRAVGARGHERDVRGGAYLPGPRAALADRGAARGDHLPHCPHSYPHAAQARS